MKNSYRERYVSPYVIKNFQISIQQDLRQLYLNVPVEREWSALAHGSATRSGTGPEIYCPRLDLAIGPFATDRMFIERYDYLMNVTEIFIQSLIEFHTQNIERFKGSNNHTSFDMLKDKNPNARCFLAIEIENQVSRKHLMGGAINACALGRIALVVGWTDDKLKAFVRLREYFLFLDEYGKNTFDTTNLLILNPNQLRKGIEIGIEASGREDGLNLSLL